MVTRGGEYCLGEGVKGGLGPGVELIHCLGVDCVLVTQSYWILGDPPWTVAHQFPLSTGFSRQHHWSGRPRPPAGELPDPGVEPRSPTWQVDSLLYEPPGKVLFTILFPDSIVCKNSSNYTFYSGQFVTLQF